MMPISVNRNSIKASIAWDSLEASLADMKKEILDLQGTDSWNEHREKILGPTSVSNNYKFYEFLIQIEQARIKTLEDRKVLVLYGNRSYRKNHHMILDFKCILKILKKLLEDRDIQSLKLNEMEESSFQFYNTLESLLRFEMQSICLYEP